MRTIRNGLPSLRRLPPPTHPNKYEIRSISSHLCQLDPTPRPPIIWTYLKDFVRYQDGLEFQNSLVRHKIDNPSAPDWLILLQHHPVYTTGRRQQSDNQLELERDRLSIVNPTADFYPTLRGGQTTFHGPGQLVAYPILNLSLMDLNTRMYVDFLMNLLRSILVHPTLPRPIISLDPSENPDLPVGIFIGTQWCKIASVGIQVRRRITSHGFALNIEQECERGFKDIVACGLQSTKLTSIQSVLARSSSQTLINVTDLVKPTVDLFGKLSGKVMKEMNQDCRELDPIGYQLVDKFIHSQKKSPNTKLMSTHK
ncbi:hypothetical protein PTTG_12482 [Puccinia triticina 1-1 BBBD Race 1]|uniref:lipoyl(octanoyl) transferase n=2 Tax=Puccinia triticina TaxID=208348 RepID=A0A180GCA8_PUCT1|nr:uncharacterized protein PtA15_13A8 [Puccinia triticina]OAV89982.1 hypothetical protein PTTG_12482 [Puccinia triticina 1-1 BBBD Race 1]WAQ90610.1 hypothetical protein PtA15_13A8 [Puccinia triticina]WAR60764.1 hypothetical protein PtB15_13B8 [Puccinia triticina]